MSLRRTAAIARRIADLFRRDHRTLALVFVASRVLTGWTWHGAEAGLAAIVVIAWAAAVIRRVSRWVSGGPRRHAQHA